MRTRMILTAGFIFIIVLGLLAAFAPAANALETSEVDSEHAAITFFFD